MASRNESRSVNIYINGNAADQTLKQIEASSRKLRNELRQLVPDTEAFRLKTEELRSVNDRLQAINNDIRGVGGAFGWLKTEIGKLGALAVGYLGFQFVTQQFHDIIAGNAKLSDSLADVQRVAGLTSQEVLKLNAGFKDIDTRTSVAGLRNIAIIAGKLGVAKDDILGFTKAVDMLVVTLGDELGNADQITTQLGKILNVYDGKVTGDNITHLGNAMVVLANAGVASGGFIADFTQRVSGIAVSAHLSLGATVGLAAGLEELGQRSESASTAITRLLTDIANDLPKAAKIAQLPLQQFTELFNEKPEKALLAYAAGLVKNKTAFNEIATSFKDAGEEGQRVIGTLAALGNKAEFMQGKIDMGNKSLTETAAINEGFALKNETFGATVDKLSKKFSELTANKGLVSLFSALVTLTSEAIDGFNKHTAAIGGFIKLLVSGGVAYAAYNVILLASIVLQGKWIATLVETAAYTRLVEAAQTAYSVVVLLLMGRVKQARVVMLAFNESMEMNPIGLVIAAMAAAVTAVILFKDTINDAAEAQKTLNKVHNEAV
jgi:TP901 family phage tail tape measure protein